MIVAQTLKPSRIKVPLKSKDKESAIKELVDVLDAERLLSDKNVVLNAILTREKTRSTGIGFGIAIPHGKCNAVGNLLIAVGITEQPIDFQSIDNKPVTTIILLVSPADQTGPHIQALASISRLMLDEQFRNNLRNAGSAQKVYELFRNHENI